MNDPFPLSHMVGLIILARFAWWQNFFAKFAFPTRLQIFHLQPTKPHEPSLRSHHLYKLSGVLLQSPLIYTDPL